MHTSPSIDLKIHYANLETHERFKRMIFNSTIRNKQIFGVISFIKLQNDA